MKTIYVCGFCFDEKLQQVALIWKEKPEWQKGNLNGIGGKVEDNESSLQAMRREFKEETGVDVEDWHPLCTLSERDWHVSFYYSATNNVQYVETMESEEVALLDVNRLDDYNQIENLQWLIPLAIYRIKYPKQEFHSKQSH